MPVVVKHSLFYISNARFSQFPFKTHNLPKAVQHQRDSRLSLTTPTSQKILQILAVVCYYALKTNNKKILVKEKKPQNYAVFYLMKRNISDANYTLLQIRESSCFLSCFSCPRSYLAWFLQPQAFL